MRVINAAESASFVFKALKPEKLAGHDYYYEMRLDFSSPNTARCPDQLFRVPMKKVHLHITLEGSPCRVAMVWS